jgi:hypothetical protein
MALADPPRPHRLPHELATLANPHPIETKRLPLIETPLIRVHPCSSVAQFFRGHNTFSLKRKDLTTPPHPLLVS